MSKPHPMALLLRVVGFVEEGHSHRVAASRLRVSGKFVNDTVIVSRESGGLEPRAQGNGGGDGKLNGVTGSIRKRMAGKPDLALNDLVAELADRHGITIGHHDPPRLGVAAFARPGFDTRKEPARRRAETD